MSRHVQFCRGSGGSQKTSIRYRKISNRPQHPVWSQACVSGSYRRPVDQNCGFKEVATLKSCQQGVAAMMCKAVQKKNCVRHCWCWKTYSISSAHPIHFTARRKSKQVLGSRGAQSPSKQLLSRSTTAAVATNSTTCRMLDTRH